MRFVLALGLVLSSVSFGGVVSTCSIQVQCRNGAHAGCTGIPTKAGEVATCERDRSNRHSSCTVTEAGGAKETRFVCCGRDGEAVTFSGTEAEAFGRCSGIQ